MNYRRDVAIFVLLAVSLGVLMLKLIHAPGYTDAYYYFNAGQRLVEGKGLTDAAIWSYMGIPSTVTLPAPSHLYWMPLTSLVAAVGMFIGGTTFDAARLPFILIYAGFGLVGFSLGAILGKTRRTAWIAGLLTLFSGYFTAYWINTDTFAIYGLVGSLCLLTMGLGRKSGDWRWFALSGLFAGLAHLTRADGLLLIVIVIIVALWPKTNLKCAVIAILAYLIIMTPWFIRNYNAVGSILPLGGLQTAWMRSYPEIFNYPPGVNLSDFVSWGAGNILSSRVDGLIFGVENLIALEGIILLTPFMLIALWRRRQDALLSGFWLYALGLHLAMTLVFRFPGENGGLLHSSSALMPFWAALGIVGLDDVIAWAAPRRRWHVRQAKAVFGFGLVVWAVAFSLFILINQSARFNNQSGYFETVAAHLPANASVIINDPSELYYYTKISGVRLPTADPTVIPQLAQRFGVNYIVLDDLGTPPQMHKLYERSEVPSFLTEVYHDSAMVIYKINP